ncbi:MAG: ATP-dependent DNA ligase [Planctomycetes bacterium]|nr:ATP-dependent DNA ligase [Planctomycetota bacterium]
MPQRVTVQVGNRTLELSNLGKLLYPQAGFTKQDYIDYLRRIAPVLLPHLEGRPLSMKRYPDGVEGFFFFEKRCPAHRPSWISTSHVTGGAAGPIDFCMANDLPSLVWLGNIACLELHTYLYRGRQVDRPTSLVFDLDPGAPAGLGDCLELGEQLRELLAHHGLESFAKTSGGKGLHVFVPLNTAVDFAATKAFAKATAQAMERRFPERVVSLMAKKLRDGKVFIDWSQNDQSKTTCCVYSLRALAQPTVSTPVTWEEIAVARKARKPERLVFTAPALIKRVDRLGDLFAPVLTKKQKLPAFSEDLVAH